MLIKSFFAACSGKRVWKKRITDKSALIVVFPDVNEYRKFGISFAEPFARLHGYEKIVFVSNDAVIGKAADVVVKMPHQFALLDSKEMDRLLRFFAFHMTFMGYTIFDNVKIISPDRLQGKASAAIAEHAIFEPGFLTRRRMLSRQYICAKDIDASLFVYTGEDAELKSFFS